MELRQAPSRRRVFDPHVHSFMDWERFEYSYDESTIFRNPWNIDDYAKATQPSMLPPTEFLYMSLVGGSPQQYIEQCVAAQEQAAEILQKQQRDPDHHWPRMIGIVSSANPALIQGKFGSFLDELQAAASMVVGVRPCPLPWDSTSAMVEILQEIANRVLVWDVFLTDQQQLGQIQAAVSRVLISLPSDSSHAQCRCPT